MPKILVINPNTSASMSADIRATAQKVFKTPWEVSVANALAGPESLESWYDYHLASVTILPLLAQYPDIEGVVLACFGDPGLYVLKEICKAPVVGIAEAAMAMSLLVGGRFGILAGMNRAVQLMDSMVRTYGMEGRYCGTVSMDMRVLGFEKDRAQTLKTLEAASQELVKRGADVLLLGCAGLTSFIEEIQALVPVVIIDPVEAGCRMIQTVVESKLNISRSGLYSTPSPQRMNSLERVFSSEMTAFLRNRGESEG
ncbi:MAG: aspartate/glutamate racemase family protein [Anaerolineaceae bacterium]|nr:aspartate/glutamate racemase family protein [Anaerolineaceae bacterium]